MLTSDHPRPLTGVRAVVVGAYVLDCLVNSPYLPAWGRERQVDAITTSPGGKALNQATVLARHGARVTAIGVVGDDAVGRDLFDTLGRDGMDTSAMTVHPTASTGVCVVFSHPDQGSAIMWRVPAELEVTSAVVELAAQPIRDADVVVITGEPAPEAVATATTIARAAGTRVVLTPAPIRADARHYPWHEIDVLVPNESEARQLLPDADPARHGPAEDLPRAVAEALDVPYVCVTLAERGCATWNGVRSRAYPAHRAVVADVTAAGDTFTATLALHLAAGADHEVAVHRALAAAAVTVSRPGSYDSLPRQHELVAPDRPHIRPKSGDSGLATEPTAETTGRSASSA